MSSQKKKQREEWNIGLTTQPENSDTYHLSRRELYEGARRALLAQEQSRHAEQKQIAEHDDEHRRLDEEFSEERERIHNLLEAELASTSFHSAMTAHVSTHKSIRRWKFPRRFFIHSEVTEAETVADVDKLIRDVNRRRPGVQLLSTAQGTSQCT